MNHSPEKSSSAEWTSKELPRPEIRLSFRRVYGLTSRYHKVTGQPDLILGPRLLPPRAHSSLWVHRSSEGTCGAHRLLH